MHWLYDYRDNHNKRKRRKLIHKEAVDFKELCNEHYEHLEPLDRIYGFKNELGTPRKYNHILDELVNAYNILHYLIELHEGIQEELDNLVNRKRQINGDLKRLFVLFS